MNKMTAISQMLSSDAFSWMNIFYFDWNFTEDCLQGSNWQQLSIRSDNGLAPNIGDKPLSEPMMTQFTDAYVR